VAASKVQTAAELQVQGLLRALDEGHSDAARRSAMSVVNVAHTTASSFGALPQAPLVDALDEQLALVKSCVRERTGGLFLEVDESCIEGAGQGVFVSSEVEAGTVVALYPGKVYLPFQVNRLEDEVHRQRGSQAEGAAMQAYYDLFGTPDNRNPHVVQRFDGVTINGRDGSVSHKPNYFAVGHKINHPPKGLMPNVMVCPFDFTTQFMERLDRTSANLRTYIPNDHYKNTAVTPSWWWRLTDRSIFVQSLLFVTTRPIRSGEELLVNYRFNPQLSESWPSWYHPVDVDEDERRWSPLDS